jgi:hypothetical protein
VASLNLSTSARMVRAVGVGVCGSVVVGDNGGRGCDRCASWSAGKGWGLYGDSKEE